MFSGGKTKRLGEGERARLGRACLRSMTSQFSNSSNIDVMKRMLKEFLALPWKQQARVLGKSYLRHEAYLVTFSGRTEIASRSLREYVLEQYPKLQNSPPCNVFFMDESGQELTICHFFLLRIIANAYTLGQLQAASLKDMDTWLTDLPQEKTWPPPLPTNQEDAPTSDQEWVTVLEGFNASLFTHLKRLMSNSQAVVIYEKAFAETSDNYLGLAAFSAVCNMLPKILLDDERMGLLPGRKPLMNKLTRLHAAHQELTGAYHGIQKAQDDLKGAQLSLNENASYVMTLLDTASEAILGLDEEGEILMSNGRALAMWKLSESSAVKAPFIDLLTESSGLLFEDTIRSVRTGTETAYWLEMEGVKTTGDVFPIKVHAQASRHSDLCITLAVRDLSEEKRLEMQEADLRTQLERAARMESIGLLAGGVAHDLNNILGPMVAYPGLILETMTEDNEFYNDVQEMGSSAQRASAIIQDLLTMSRRGYYEFSPVSLSAVIRDYLCSPGFKNPFASISNLTMQVNLDDDAPLVMGSEHHINKILMNLCSHALDAMPSGGVLSISTAYLPDDPSLELLNSNHDQGVVECRIGDTGEGIPPEHLERIFEPSYATKTPGHRNAGLGLSVAYSVIQDLGGQIDVRSTPGEGTEFMVKLPAVFAAAEEPRADEIIPIGQERVLIVDDDASQLKLASRLLSNLGYQVYCVPHGQAAIDFLHQQQVDLVLLDMVMEDGFDGLDTYRVIHVRWPRLACIIASGYSESDRVKEAIRLEAFGLLKKPYSKRELAFSVRRALDHDPSESLP
jgi:PAS domain S-box-containing protein